MSMASSRITQRFGQSIGVELRIGSRTRDRTHVDELIDAYVLEQS